MSFTRDGLLDALFGRSFRRITFRYIALDGEMRELRFPIIDRAQADRVLACGERVDGSSLFKGLIDVGASDLYVMPRYHTAFIDPFDPADLSVLCRFADRDGAPAAFSPDVLAERAARSLYERTGLEAGAAVELEFFLLGDAGHGRRGLSPEGAYHATLPAVHHGHVVDEMVACLTTITDAVKYAHAEAGFVASLGSEREELAGACGEQHEIELLPLPLPEMADLVAVSRWVVRTVAYRHGLRATFAPMVAHDVPGNGSHCHLELTREGVSVMTDALGGLSPGARRLVGGLLAHAPSLCAFGNTASTSYLRLAAAREAPESLSWSHGDRKALVRVPLAWRRDADLARTVNPREPREYRGAGSRQTVELRLPDGSAQPHALLSGLAAAAEWGLTRRESEHVAAATYVGEGAGPDEATRPAARPPLPSSLPASCYEAGRCLRRDRRLYEERGVFPPALVDRLADDLEARGTLCESDATLDDDARRRRERRCMDEDVLRF